MDQILYWNEVALEANRLSHPTPNDMDKMVGGPPLSARALAIVHLAMYDAYVGTAATTLLHYLPATPAVAVGASVDAAIAAAAHATLSKLYPSMKNVFDMKHAQAGVSMTGVGVNDGHEYGQKIANLILADRGKDPDTKDDGYASVISRGKHRPDPDNSGQGYHAPFYGAASKLFSSSARYSLTEPPQPGDMEYTKALKQVRGKGIAPELMGTLPSTYPKRKVDETLIGIFWAFDGAKELGTPPRFYNQIVQQIAKNKGNSLEQNVQLFALINVAMADAGILAWEQKYKSNFWRPVLGIREHDKSMGIVASVPTSDISDDCDPNWLPLGAPKTNETAKNFTPPFPAYPSGHATFGAAAFHTVRMFYGINPNDTNPDTLLAGIDFVSEECNGINKDNKGTIRPHHLRHFPKGLWQMIVENGFSRIYLGVHWSFDAFALDAAGNPDLTQNIGGVKLGLNIAKDIFMSKLKKSTV